MSNEKLMVKNTVEVESVPNEVQEVIDFLNKQHHDSTQVQYEIDNALEGLIEACEELGEDIHEEVYQAAYPLTQDSNPDYESEKIQAAINRLEGNWTGRKHHL